MKKRAAFLIGIGCILLVASSAFAVSNHLESQNAARAVEALSEAFMSETAAIFNPVSVQPPDVVDENGYYVEQPLGIEPYEAPPRQSVVIDGQEFIGLLSIPRLGVSLPVNNNIDYQILRDTPCRYFGSAAEGTLIVAAHNYDSHFGRIGTLVPGDQITLKNASGIVYFYRVSEVLILANDAVEQMIAPGEWDLTLFTCTYSGMERITVRSIKEDRV